jgi:hypothetical protein
MELETPHSDSISLRILHIAHRATRRATDACQIGKEHVLSAGLSVHIQSDGFATEHSLSLSFAADGKALSLLSR